MGWGEVINGGFGLVLDGGAEADRRAQAMLYWDVNNGIARRAWARNPGASSPRRGHGREPRLKVTLPELAEEQIIRSALEQAGLV